MSGSVSGRSRFRGALLATSAAVFLFCVLHARDLWRTLTVGWPRRTPVPASAEATVRAEFPALQAASLHTSDGLRLPAWFVPGSRRSMVVLVHGGGGNRLSLLPEARVLARHGHGFLLYDSRVEGDGEGRYCGFGDGEQRDLTAALDFALSRPEVDPARVAVLGFSIGGSTAALTSARDPRVRALILYATWTSLEEEMKTNYGALGPLSWGPRILLMKMRGVDFANVRPIDHLRDFAPRPLLMIAGTDDTDTPLPVMQRLFDAAGEPKSLWIVRGAEHGAALRVAPAEWEARVSSFLDRALLSIP